MDRKTKFLDSLTINVTAFDSFAELISHMERGYIPTIRTNTRRKRLLRSLIVARGFRVFGN